MAERIRLGETVAECVIAVNRGLGDHVVGLGDFVVERIVTQVSNAACGIVLFRDVAIGVVGVDRDVAKRSTQETWQCERLRFLDCFDLRCNSFV